MFQLIEATQDITERQSSAAQAGSSAEIYSERESRFAREAKAARDRRNRLSHWRFAVFVATATTAAMWLFGGPGALVVWSAMTVALAVWFLWLVRLQRRAERSRARASDLARINAQANARTRRSWGQLPPANAPAPEVPPIARDLNLFGRGSLFQLLGTVATADGRRMLAEWLVEPASVDVIPARQSAVRELATRLELRQEIELLARPTPPGETLRAFSEWASGTSWARSNRLQVHLARALPAALLALGVAYWLALLPPLWIALIPANAVLWLLTARRVGVELEGVELRADEIERYRALLRLLSESQFESEHLRSLQRVLEKEGIPADAWIRRLQRIVEAAEVRYSPIVYLPLQLLTLWDIHLADLLDRWKAQAGQEIGGWLLAVGEVDALAALAALSFDNPAWAFPRIDDEVDEWTADGLAHPLLPEVGRVGNDVRIGPAGSFLLVTGSNMSGKSTLLRALGVNIVLAHAGGPVCADALTIPPTRLGTSFVIEDSLETGVSFFLAELKRLKTLIDEAGSWSTDRRWRYLFLLDEILKGTNSGERQIAVRRVLLELLSWGTSGAISTHDLALADVTELRERSVRVHFREQFSKSDGLMRMDFDYRLRPGIASTSNALALLEMIGIEGG
jgi:MutS domain V